MLGLLIIGTLAASISDTNAPDPPHPVVGGSEAHTCEFASTVAIFGEGGCSGTLIHPELVAYAGHCPVVEAAVFGENIESPQLTVPIVECARPDDYVPGSHTDYRVCRLEAPVADVPVTEPLVGCDRQRLAQGDAAFVVGFGRDTAGGPDIDGVVGRKRYLAATMSGFAYDGRLLRALPDAMSDSACYGDSGGSLLVQGHDGSWRLAGVTVAASCSETGNESDHASAVEMASFAESAFGLDVMPCYDDTMRWSPTAECARLLAVAPGSGGATWADGCAAAAAGASAGCGPAYGDPADTEPPVLTLVVDEDVALDVPISLVADVDDDWPIRTVTITVTEAQGTETGLDLVELSRPPWRVDNVILPIGAWTVTASAEDWSGNVATQEASVVVGGDDGSTTEGTNGTSGSSTGTADSEGDDGTTGGVETGTTTDTSGEDTGVAPQEDDSGSSAGCGCKAEHPGPSGAVGWASLALLLAVRRRR